MPKKYDWVEREKSDLQEETRILLMLAVLVLVALLLIFLIKGLAPVPKVTVSEYQEPSYAAFQASASLPQQLGI